MFNAVYLNWLRFGKRASHQLTGSKENGIWAARTEGQGSIRTSSGFVQQESSEHWDDNQHERAHLQLAHSVFSPSFFARLFPQGGDLSAPSLCLELPVPWIIALTVPAPGHGNLKHMTSVSFYPSPGLGPISSSTLSILADASSKFCIECNKKWPWSFLNVMETRNRSPQGSCLFWCQGRESHHLADKQWKRETAVTVKHTDTPQEISLKNEVLK